MNKKYITFHCAPNPSSEPEKSIPLDLNFFGLFFTDLVGANQTKRSFHASQDNNEQKADSNTTTVIPKILLATLRANIEEPNWNREESVQSFFGIGHL